MAVIYIKAERNIEVSNPRVRLGDVLKIESQDPKLLEQIKKIPLMTFQNTDQKQESRAAISAALPLSTPSYKIVSNIF